MRVYTNNKERTIQEMTEMFVWVRDRFGDARAGNPRTWTYGKEPGFLGSSFCDGPFDVEWFDIDNEDDIIMFKLRWGDAGPE